MLKEYPCPFTDIFNTSWFSMTSTCICDLIGIISLQPVSMSNCSDNLKLYNFFLVQLIVLCTKCLCICVGSILCILDCQNFLRAFCVSLKVPLTLTSVLKLISKTDYWGVSFFPLHCYYIKSKKKKNSNCKNHLSYTGKNLWT